MEEEPFDDHDLDWEPDAPDQDWQAAEEPVDVGVVLSGNGMLLATLYEYVTAASKVGLHSICSVTQ